MRRRDSGVTLVEVAAAVTLFGIILALVIPAWVRGSRFQKVLGCSSHLHTMYQVQAKAPEPGPKQLGGEYWLRLTQGQPPPLDKETLRCPLVDAPDAPALQYLGPSAEPGKASEKDPIGCDLEYNHSEDGKQGGNVLLKSGEVVTDRTGLWGSAIHHGKCRP